MAVKKQEVEIVEFKKTESVWLTKAKELEIKGEDDMKVAVELLSQLNQINDARTEEKEKVTKPLNLALKNERARWKPGEEQLEMMISMIRSKMSKYQTEAVRIAREEEDKIIGRIGEGKGKLKVETAVAKLEDVEHAPDRIAGNSGMVKFKTVKKFEVVDVKILPPEFLLPNEVAIREAMTNGRELDGVRYWDEQVPINFR